MSSSASMSEEKSLLLPPESSEEKYNIPEDRSLKEHNKAVYQGVALVVKRWPDHVSSGWTSVIYLAFITSAFSLIFLFTVMFSKMKISVDLRFQVGRYNLHHNETLLDIIISCEGQTGSTKRFAQVDEPLSHPRFLQFSQHQLLNPLADQASNTTIDDSVEPLDRMFFISREEGLTSEGICSVESAANSLPNTEVYFFLLHNDNQEPPTLTLFAEGLQTVYKNLSVHRIGTKRYFSDSPMSEMLEHISASKYLSPGLIELAARVLTLWRYGGMSVDSTVAVRNGSPFPGRGNATGDDVVLSQTGSVISTVYQCHEFLFQIMSTLTKLLNSSEHAHIASNEILSLAVKNFCVNKTSKSDSVDIICPGLSLMKPELMCKTDDSKDTCMLKRINGMLPMEKEQLCPLTFKQQSLIY